MEFVIEIPRPQTLVFSPGHSSGYASTKIYKEVSNDEERYYAFTYDGDKDRKHDNGYYKLIEVRKLKNVEVTRQEKVEISKVVGYSSNDWTIKKYRDRYFDNR
jgi:predicted nucleic acid-binding OB-fold protein